MYQIDFFELLFLTEVCIPPVPIARTMFFQKIIGTYYNIMSKHDRQRMFEFIIKNDKFDMKNELCLMFYNRYNPDNQYLINNEYEAFLHNEKYYVDLQRFFDNKQINTIRKI